MPWRDRARSQQQQGESGLNEMVRIQKKSAGNNIFLLRPTSGSKKKKVNSQLTRDEITAIFQSEELAKPAYGSLNWE